MAGQEQAGAWPRAGERARDERQAGARHLRAGVVGVGREGDGIGVPGADRQAEVGHLPRHGVARGALVAGDGRDCHEREEVGLDRRRVDRRRGTGGARRGRGEMARAAAELTWRCDSLMLAAAAGG